MPVAKMKKANKNEKIALLNSPTGTWSYSDIMKYFNFSYGVANKVLKLVEEEKGTLKAVQGTRYRRVKIDDVLELYGTSRRVELELLLLQVKE